MPDASRRKPPEPPSKTCAWWREYRQRVFAAAGNGPWSVFDTAEAMRAVAGSAPGAEVDAVAVQVEIGDAQIVGTGRKDKAIRPGTTRHDIGPAAAQIIASAALTER